MLRRWREAFVHHETLHVRSAGAPFQQGEKKMSKVETGTARKIWPCNFKDCRRKIGKGQEYYLWHIRPGYLAQRQHTEHGEPAQPAPKKKTTKKAKGGKKQ